MPALIFCDRRIQIASDDFPLPSSCAFIFRIFWCVGLGLVYYYSNFDCRESAFYELYLIGAIALFGFLGIVDILLIFFSSRGTVMDPKSRKLVSPLLYIHFIILIFETAWTAIGTYWAFIASNECDLTSGINVMFAIIVVSNWIYLFILAFSIACLFTVICSGYVDDPEVQTLEKLWEERCSTLFCCAGVRSAESQVFSELAEILADFVKGIDFVPSDVAASLKLLHSIDTQYHRNNPYDISTHDHVEIADISEAYYWMRYALGSYGWMLYVFMNLKTGLCNLPCFTGCCSPSDTIHGDNCMRWNETALRKQIGNLPIILFANFSNPLYHTPYFIAIDHGKKSIVISVRGTLSLRDLLVDAHCHDSAIKVDGIKNKDTYAHKGIWQAAQSVKKDIDDHGILKKACKEYKDYKLMIVGHSLGAGSAALLSVILRKKYRNLHCYAFSPPGGLLSLSAAKHCQKWITSVIIGHDMIPRLSRGSMEHLRDRMVMALQRFDGPKYRLLCNPCFDFNTVINHVKDYDYRLSEIDGELVDLEKNKYGTRKLFPPGKIMHFIEANRIKKCCGVEKKYVAIWDDNDNFKEIIVSSEMLTCHLPDFVSEVLQKSIVEAVTSSVN